jgi:quercetin dioxygenase-like cupin family protein
MKSLPLLEGLVFGEQDPNAQPLLVDGDARILRFTLRPGQKVKEHRAPHSPLYIVILSGRGRFTGGGQTLEAGPQTLLTFAQGETHAIEALAEDLVFLAILKGVTPGAPQASAGGLLNAG